MQKQSAGILLYKKAGNMLQGPGTSRGAVSFLLDETVFPF